MAVNQTAVNVVETLLPGVGLKYEMRTRSGVPLTLVVNREGGSVLVAYDKRDPDRAALTVPLDDEESEALAGLLSGTTMMHRVEDVTRLPGLVSGRLAVETGSKYDGRTLGDTRARTRTGCSIVAVVRAGEVLSSPGPELVLQGGDVLVVIGTDAGVAQLRDILANPT